MGAELRPKDKVAVAALRKSHGAFDSFSRQAAACIKISQGCANTKGCLLEEQLLNQVGVFHANQMFLLFLGA